MPHDLQRVSVLVRVRVLVRVGRGVANYNSTRDPCRKMQRVLFPYLTVIQYSCRTDNPKPETEFHDQ